MRKPGRIEFVGLVCAVLFAGAASAEEVPPGFTVEVYAHVTDPVCLTFAPHGVLYVGRDKSGSGGGQPDPAKIHRVGVGGSPVVEYGETETPDPDAVLFDGVGDISGVPGSVLVGGMISGGGLLSAIWPDERVVTVFEWSRQVNPAELKFDSTGRLVCSDYYNARVWVYTGGLPAVLYTLPSAAYFLTIDTQDSIFTSADDGRVRKHDSQGNLLHEAYAILGSSAPIEFGPGGAFGSGLYALEITTGTLYRIDKPGELTVFGTGFQGAQDIAFGPDDALYVSDFDDDRLLRVARLPLGDLNCDGVVNFDDIDPFVLALSNPSGYNTQFPDCDITLGDINQDGKVNFEDIDPFVALLVK